MAEFFSFKMFTHKIVPEPVPSMCVQKHPKPNDN